MNELEKMCVDLKEIINKYGYSFINEITLTSFDERDVRKECPRITTYKRV